MIRFNTNPPQVAQSLSEARKLWTKNKTAVPIGAQGHRWLATLLREAKADAPPEHHAWYEQQAAQHEHTANFIGQPPAYRSPL